MQGLNRIFLLGYLGHSPKMYSTKNGHQFVAFSIATRRQSAEAEGEEKTRTDWHYVRVWGKQADNCVRLLEKGQPVMVEGYLSQYSQAAEDGTTERKTGINAIRVDFLPRANRAESIENRPEAST